MRNLTIITTTSFVAVEKQRGLFIENSTLEQEMEGKYIVFGKGVE